jgi:hypothetical protein
MEIELPTSRWQNMSQIRFLEVDDESFKNYILWLTETNMQKEDQLKSKSLWSPKISDKFHIL